MHTRRGGNRKIDIAAIAGLPVVHVRGDGRFCRVSEAARLLLGRGGRVPRSWSDTVLPMAEAGRLAWLARRVGHGGGAQVQVVVVPDHGGTRYLEARLHGGAVRGEAVVLFAEPLHSTATTASGWSSAVDQAMATEVHHRVRNALQVMAALIHLESGDATLTSRLEPIRRRILAMAQAHDSLNVRDGVVMVDLAACIRSIHGLACADQATEPSVVRLQIDAASPDLSVDVAVPVALIIHEALSQQTDPQVAPWIGIGQSDGKVRVDLHGVVGGGRLRDSRLVQALARQAGIWLNDTDDTLVLEFAP